MQYRCKKSIMITQWLCVGRASPLYIYIIADQPDSCNGIFMLISTITGDSLTLSLHHGHLGGQIPDRFKTSWSIAGRNNGQILPKYQFIMISSSFWMSFFSPIVLFSCSVLCSVICQQETKMQGWWGLNGFISIRQINGGWLQLTVRQHLPHKDYIVRMWHCFRLMVQHSPHIKYTSDCPLRYQISSVSDSF